MQRYAKLFTRKNLTSATALLLYLAFIKLCIQLATNFTPGGYGIFRDELYYFDAGQHLAPGYVEFPALIGILAALVNALFGRSLFALHVLPALAGACLVFFTGLIARQLGGGKFAQCLAAIASLSAVTFLAFGSLFTIDAFDELWWVLATYVLIRLIKEERPRLWLLFGLITGIGLLTKLSIVAFGFAIVVGLLLTPRRTYLLSKWAWLGGLLAFAFLVPYVLWNATNGWPTVDFWQSYASNHANPADAIGFLYQQILTMNPLTLPLWLAGLYYFFFNREGKSYRVLGWAYLILYVLFTLSRAKLYFLAPAYPALYAGGAVAFERATALRLTWLRPIYGSLILLMGLLLSPLAMPVLPPATYVNATAIIGGNAGVKVENRTTGQLPQQLADRFSWDTQVATIAHVYNSLPPQERAQTCIFANNYGEAGAIDFFGPRYGLPQAISGHNSYYLWGHSNCNHVQAVIVVGKSYADIQPAFERIVQGGMITCSYCMPEENNLPVYIGYHLKEPFDKVWASARHYD